MAAVKSNPLRLGLVSFAWTEQHNGGLRSHVRDMAHKLSEFGVRVHVFCVNTDPSAKPFETCSWTEGSIQIQAMNYAYHDLATFFDFQHVPQAGVVLCEWAQRLKLHLIDLHHNLFIGMSVIPQLAAITPTVVTLHDYWPLDPRGQLFGPDHQPQQVLSARQWEAGARLTWPIVFERSQICLNYYAGSTDDDPTRCAGYLQSAWVNYSRRALAASRLLITPSQASADVFHNHGVSQTIKVIENGIDTSFLHNAICRESNRIVLPDNRLRLALLGNIAPSKGQLAFCKACLDPALAEQFELHLYGSCPPTYHGDPRPQSELLELCEQHPETICHHNAYQRSNLPQIFARSDLVVMPSLWHEVYGLTAREALCYGLPLIVSDAGGLRELSDRSRVLILNHLQPSGWAEQLKQWLFEGPLIKWVYYRRLRMPPPDNTVRNAEQCASELLSTYQRLISGSQGDQITISSSRGRPSLRNAEQA